MPQYTTAYHSRHSICLYDYMFPTSGLFPRSLHHLALAVYRKFVQQVTSIAQAYPPRPPPAFVASSTTPQLPEAWKEVVSFPEPPKKLKGRGREVYIVEC